MSLVPLLAPDPQHGRADEVVRRITEAIHLGLLADGERLPVEVELAAQFGVAPMRLRELSVSDLRDLVDEHTAVAAQAARLAAERISPVSARRLFALTDHLGTAQTLGDRIRADSRFHIEVAVASQSARLTRLEANLQAEVSGLVWLPIGPPVDVEALVAEHHAIAAAVVGGDAELARRLGEEHVMSNLGRLTALRLEMDKEPAS